MRAIWLAPALTLALTVAGCAQQDDVEARALFGFDREAASADGLYVISDFALQAEKAGKGGARIDGHADTVGDTAYNLKLSQRRARFVRRELMARMMPATGLSLDAHGERDLLVETDEGVREPLNRRVDLQATTLTETPKPARPALIPIPAQR